MGIRVVLVDDHKIVRDGLNSLLSREMDIEVIGEGENGREALALCDELCPDVVVMDIGMRDLNGVDATRRILETHPEIKIVALSMHSDQSYVSAMLAAGASGYLLKDGAFEELARAIRAVSEGQTYLSQGVAGVLVQDYVRRVNAPADTLPSRGRALTGREREVLQLIAEGASTKEIATQLHLSVKTIETHRRQIMEKLGIYNVAGLVKYAVREGIASLED